MRYARVEFGGMEVEPELRAKWQGKLVDYDCGWGWSLEGRQDEGIGLTAPETCFTRLSDDERRIANLLDETFWERTWYTEDEGELLALLRAKDA